MSQMHDVFYPDGIKGHTFLGLPACEDLTQLEASVAIIGAPIATPYPGFGVFSATTAAVLATPTILQSSSSLPSGGWPLPVSQ